MRAYLVVANRTLPSSALHAAIRERLAQGPAMIHVVVPITPVGHALTWDEDESRIEATGRLAAFTDWLQSLGVGSSGEVGDRDPVQAVRDALRDRSVDEIILSTLPPGISRWLGQDVPSRLQAANDTPVTVVFERTTVAAG